MWRTLISLLFASRIQLRPVMLWLTSRISQIGLSNVSPHHGDKIEHISAGPTLRNIVIMTMF
jgi:hypothetical protein